jgi:hypothetical protein
MRIPWSEMKAEDVIDWPSDVKFRSIRKMTMSDVEKLHELAKEDKLDFSPEFLRGRRNELAKGKLFLYNRK